MFSSPQLAARKGGKKELELLLLETAKNEWNT